MRMCPFIISQYAYMHTMLQCIKVKMHSKLYMFMEYTLRNEYKYTK